MTQPVFRRYAGSLQVRIESFDDLRAAMDLPDALWVALACPVQGFAADPAFLTFLDIDRNARVRPEELRAGVNLVSRLLRDTSGVDAASDVLVLDHLSEEGARLADTARMILDALGKTDADRISLDQVRRSEAALKAVAATGDGIVAPASVADERLQALARQVLACLPAKTNRAGEAGFDVATLEEFDARRKEGLALLDRRAQVDVLGDGGLERAKAVLALAPRLDEYFLQCRLVAAQPEAGEALRLKGAQLEAMLGDTQALARWLGALPVAPPDPAGRLHWAQLYRGPAFEALERLRRDVCEPLLGTADVLDEASWRSLLGKAQALVQWHEESTSEPVRALGEALRAIDPADLTALGDLCRADLARRDLLDAVTDLERLVLYQRWIVPFANNFVSMPDLYDPASQALFQAGTLTLAGRHFDFAVRVPDRAAHAGFAAQSSMCLAYVRVESGASGAPPYEVVVPVTSGTSRGIDVGRRGVFRDREGREFDATVVQVLRQPVSLWEAITQPFTRIGAFVTSKLEGLAGAGDKALGDQLEQGWTKAQDGVKTAPDAKPEAPTTAGLGGMVAAGGVAFAAVGSSLAFIMNQLQSVSWMDLLRGLLVLVLAIAVPVGILAWLKLRRRNLAVVLEGSGWALNEDLLLTRELGALFTRRPRLPKGARVEGLDVVVNLRARVAELPHPDEQPAYRQRLAAAAVLVIALAAGAWWWWSGSVETPAPEQAPVVQPAAQEAAVPAP